jgi:hypothetical protein
LSWPTGVFQLNVFAMARAPGYLDFGVNAKRINWFANFLNQVPLPCLL